MARNASPLVDERVIGWIPAFPQTPVIHPPRETARRAVAVAIRSTAIVGRRAPAEAVLVRAPNLVPLAGRIDDILPVRRRLVTAFEDAEYYLPLHGSRGRRERERLPRTGVLVIPPIVYIDPSPPRQAPGRFREIRPALVRCP